MRAVVFAYQEVGCVCLEALSRVPGWEVAGVITHPDDPHEERWYRSVAEVALGLGHRVWLWDPLSRDERIALVRGLAPDIIFSFYFRKMIGPQILALAPRGGLNFHGSLLPRYRGRSPVNWVLVNGETETGVTLHEMVRDPDAGRIVAQRAIPIAPRETAITLYRKMLPVMRDVLAEVLPLIREGMETRSPQDESRATYFGGRRPEDGRFEWSWPSRRIDDLIRAVTHPYPGAWVQMNGRRLTVWEAEPTAGTGLPGEIIALGNGAATVATGDGALRVGLVQWEGEPEGDGERALHALSLGLDRPEGKGRVR